MARLLQGQGQQVSLLAMLDAAVPSVMLKGYQEPEDDAQFFVDFFAEVEIYLSLEHLRQLAPDEQLAYVMEQGIKANLFPPEIDLAKFQRIWHLIKLHPQVIQHYQPRSYRGKVTLFQATEKLDEIFQEPGLGWETFATEVEIHPVPGNHQNMVKSPHVQVLAEQMKICLEQALTND